jgi:hypothetical protein
MKLIYVTITLNIRVHVESALEMCDTHFEQYHAMFKGSECGIKKITKNGKASLRFIMLITQNTCFEKNSENCEDNRLILHTEILGFWALSPDI